MPRVGARAYSELTRAWGSPGQALRAVVPANGQRQYRDRARSVMRDGEACGARLLLIGDDAYPEVLHELVDPPPFLFVLGDLSVLDRPAVAIVGTRRSTLYGERTTDAIATALATAGACIVSGMARGIDGVAHRAALRCKGVTAAILGTGVDVAYPVGHRGLHRAIIERGVVISEFPCGSGAERASFPRRNRIIAALARATIVIEAGEKSGALITAEHALDLNRDIGVVPGPVDSPQCVGSNRWMQTGAYPILDAGDALMMLRLDDPVVRSAAVPELRGDERAIWITLAAGATPTDLLSEATGLPPSRALAAVTGLEMAGLVETLPTGELRRRRG